MNQPLVYAVILNWNGYNDTVELLHSLQKVKVQNLKTLVVDNNSAGNEAEKLELNFKGFIKVLKCQSNLGFAGGNNLGIKYALKDEAHYILLLNNDTIVEPGFLDILIKRFECDEKIGIVAPQINYYNMPKKIWSAGGKISKIRGSGFADSDRLETEIIQTDRIVDFVSGCCMLIKSEVFQNVGIFDENFFLYTEDTDFCYRVNKAGYKIYVTSNSKIFHKVNRSTKENFSALPLYYTTRNRLYFSKKNFHKFYFITLVYISTTMLLKSLYWIITGNLRNISAIYRAFKDYFSGAMGKTEHNYYSN